MALLTTSVPANFSTAVMYGDQNNTNDTWCPRPELDERPHIAFILFIMLGIVLNVFVLMVFFLHKKACTVPEIYLSNMAVADLILTAFFSLFVWVHANKFIWPFPDPMCPLLPFVTFMNTYCSIYFLVLISIDRYVALVHPLSHEGMRRPKYAKLGCLLVWCFGLFLGVPKLVFRKVSYSNSSNNEKGCRLHYPSKTVRFLFDVMLMTFGFIIPFSIISFCTFRIIQALNNRLTAGLNTKTMEHKATTLVLAVLLAFMICWLPLHLLKILIILVKTDFLTDCTLIRVLITCNSIFMCLAFFNSVLNPILYVIVGKNFRIKVRELFKQRSINSTATFNTMSTRSTMLRSVEQ